MKPGRYFFLPEVSTLPLVESSLFIITLQVHRDTMGLSCCKRDSDGAIDGANKNNGAEGWIAWGGSGNLPGKVRQTSLRQGELQLLTSLWGGAAGPSDPAKLLPASGYPVLWYLVRMLFVLRCDARRYR